MNDPEAVHRNRDPSRFLPLGDVDDLPAVAHPPETNRPEQRHADPATLDYIRTHRVR